MIMILKKSVKLSAMNHQSRDLSRYHISGLLVVTPGEC